MSSRASSHALVTALGNGKFNKVERLIQTGADPNTQDKHGKTPLYYAVYFNRETIVKYLIEKGANVNLRSFDGASLLHVAIIEKADHAIIKLLIEAGINVNERHEKLRDRNYGLTPLYLAVLSDRISVVKILLDHGADIIIKDGKGRVVFNIEDIAQQHGYDSIVELIRNYSTNEDLKEPESN
jgi:ankyrin repeat protein